MHELHGQKEEAFQHRTPVSKEIHQLISEVKRLKQERDQLTDEVKKHKESRTELNEQLKNKIDEAKKLNAEKKKASGKTESRDNPSYLKRLMDKLEQRIETEALQFEKEKALMKEIKELKKRYTAAKQANEIWGKSHHISKEIDALRAQADTAHREMQQKAKLSQEKHNLLVETSRKIDALKGKGDTLIKEIGEKKSEMTKLGEELDVLQKQATELRAKLDAERKEKEAEYEQKRKRTFSEKLAAVKEKMAKGGKLTTEDIIIMQGEK